MRIADPNAPTREHLLDAAVSLFMEKGFASTSVDEICARAKATKGSFFHFFKSKDELGKAAMRAQMGKQLAAAAGAGFRGLPDPKARALGWVDMAIAMFSSRGAPKGCAVAALTQELADSRPDMRAAASECLTKWRETVAEDFAAALKGRPGKHDARRLVDLFTSIAQGSMILVKATGDGSIAVENMRHYRSYLAGLFGETER